MVSGHVMPGRPVAVVAAWPPRQVDSVLWAGGRQRRLSWSVTVTVSGWVGGGGIETTHQQTQ